MRVKLFFFLLTILLQQAIEATVPMSLRASDVLNNNSGDNDLTVRLKQAHMAKSSLNCDLAVVIPLFLDGPTSLAVVTMKMVPGVDNIVGTDVLKHFKFFLN